MLTDPAFYLVSVPAVLLYGIAKGGFGGAVAILAVPLMALVMAPAQAAAILLPILVVMDFVVIYSYRGHFDARALRLLLPGALLGISAGFLLADHMNDDFMRVLVGAVALAFGLQALLGWLSRVGREHHAPAAGFFGALAGFTSFSIHAGGPPLTMYLLPKQLPPMVYAGTAGLFFWVVNLAKLPPYYALGQFTGDTLIYSAALVPIAPLGVLVGRQLVRISNPRLYYRVIALFLVIVGIKLLADGYSGLTGAAEEATAAVARPATVAAADACLYSGAG
ncbi:MAG: sulfite exporter TauE/SafE family protein [Pseudomonadota bacterium]